MTNDELNRNNTTSGNLISSKKESSEVYVQSEISKKR